MRSKTVAAQRSFNSSPLHLITTASLKPCLGIDIDKLVLSLIRELSRNSSILILN